MNTTLIFCLKNSGFSSMTLLLSFSTPSLWSVHLNRWSVRTCFSFVSFYGICLVIVMWPIYHLTVYITWLIMWLWLLLYYCTITYAYLCCAADWLLTDGAHTLLMLYR
jgi:hypothetical protein